MNRFRFWKWVRDYATRKMDQTHESPALKCPTCRRWTWETDWFKWEGDPDDDSIGYLTCGGCDQRSRWRDIGIVMIAEPFAPATEPAVRNS